MCQKEVSVFVVLINPYLKIFELCTAFATHILRFRLLLRNNGRYIEFSELQFRFYTKKCRTPLY